MNRSLIAAAAAATIAGIGSAFAQQASPPPQTEPVPATGTAETAAVPTVPTMDFSACVDRYRAVGLPYYRSEAAHDEVKVICRAGYALSFNFGSRNPDWVIERLTREELTGRATRSNKFAADPELGARSPLDSDYNRSGFDRGHMAPAADAKYDQRVMDESFYMSNMSPQVGIGFNRGQWKYLEEAVRSWVLCAGHDELLVMTGPIYGAGERHITPAGRPAIRVPEAYFKIVYDPRSRRAVGFRLANVRTSRTDLSKFIVPIAQIEDETGLDFFRHLTIRRQRQLETSKGVAWGHDQNCSGVAGD